MGANMVQSKSLSAQNGKELPGYSGADSKILGLQLKNDSLGDSNSSLKRGFLLLSIIFTILIGVGSYIVITTLNMMDEIQKSSVENVEQNRNALISGVYSINKSIEEGSYSVTKRLEITARTAKRILLTLSPSTDLNDKQINDLIILNFDLSEKYLVDFWVAWAFLAANSNFNKRYVSDIGAKGIAAFIPGMMQILMGDDYYYNCEFNTLVSLRMWYKLYISASEMFKGDLKWIAAYMLNGLSVYHAYLANEPLDDAMRRLSLSSSINFKYPWIVESLYKEFVDE